MTTHASSTDAASTVPASVLSLSSSSSLWVIHKFGGTSLATAERYHTCERIMREAIAEEEDEHDRLRAKNEKNGKINDDRQYPYVRACVVVSAMGEVKQPISSSSSPASVASSPSPAATTTMDRNSKVTNLIIESTRLAAGQHVAYLTLIDALRQRHTDAIEQLLGDSSELVKGLPSSSSSSARSIILSYLSTLRDRIIASLTSDLHDLSHILRAVWLSRTYEKDHSWWFGFGEIWSANLMASYINAKQKVDEVLMDDEDQSAMATAVMTKRRRNRHDAIYLDARDIIVLGEQGPDYALSRSNLAAWLTSSPAHISARVIVVTGYICRTRSGVPTTLGRDGSDYSASIFGALLFGAAVTIWTDVDGVYSANPSQVPDAVCLDQLSYDEASELAYFGAKVLHPKTMLPLVKHDIPIHIRNTFNDKHRGSCIVSEAKILAMRRLKTSPSQSSLLDCVPSVVGYGVCGLSEISNLCLLLVEGNGLIGVPGVCSRLFLALKDTGVNVVLVTQAGSEHSICVLVPAMHGSPGLQALRREFRDELESGELQTVDLREGVACIAVVGDGMRSRLGAAARMFAALADAGVNVVAIAQGSSERNISVVVAQQDVAKGLRAVHAAFLASDAEKKYTPLLSAAPTPSATPAPDGNLEHEARPPSPSISPSPQGSILDRLFPLQLAATLLGIVARSDTITHVSAVIPTHLSAYLSCSDSPSPSSSSSSSSSPSPSPSPPSSSSFELANLVRSQSTLSNIMAEIARISRPDGTTSAATNVEIQKDITKAKTKDEVLSILSSLPDRRSRLICTLVASTSASPSSPHSSLSSFDILIAFCDADSTSSSSTSSLTSSASSAHHDASDDCASIIIFTKRQPKGIRLEATIEASEIDKA